MPRRFIYVLGAFALCGIGVLAGFIVGVHQGVEQFHLLDSSAKASLLTYELQALRAGKVEAIIKSKEIELDGAVVGFARFQASGHGWLFWPRDVQRDHRRYMEHVASYRRQHPPVIPSLEYTVENPTKVEMESFGEEVAEATAKVLREYAK